MIQTLRAQNYKSLKDIEIPLKPLTVLVGPNAAGKSNILDCLAFLAELAHFWEGEPFKRRGGFKDMVWGGDEELLISMRLQGKLPFQGRSYPFEYYISIGSEAKGLIQEEWATFGTDGTRPWHRKRSRVFDYKEGKEAGSWSVGGFESALTKVSTQDGPPLALRRALESWAIYDFQRTRIAEPQNPRWETRLTPDGSNAARVLDTIRSGDPDTFDKVETLLKTAIPEVEHLLAPPDTEGRRYIAWKEKHVPGRIPAWNMSEGSARLVAVLLALLVPEPPSLVAIESPDISLHPHLMEYLSDILKLGSGQTQVLITTQSPYLLDQLPPESLLIVEKAKGGTNVRVPKKNKALREALKVLGLGEMWYAGHFGGVP